MSSLPKSYKALQCPGPHKGYEIVTLPLREPGPNEILIRVHASGMCFSDHLIEEGMVPGMQYPRTPGHEVVGRVAAVGSAIKENYGEDGRFKVGALVGCGWNGGYCTRCDFCRKGEFWACKTGGVTGFTFDGGHAEYMYAPETAVLTLAEEALEKASYAELAPLFCAGTTVFDAIRTSKWTPGDLCIVQGIGGLGHLAIQYAAKLGLKVIALSSGSSKRDLALSIGASEYVDSSTTDIVEYAQARGGAPLIVCTAPYSEHISKIIPAVAKNGTITLVAASWDAPIQVNNVFFNMNRVTLRGWGCGCAPDMEQCAKFSTLTGVKSIAQEYKLEEFDNAFKGVLENKARFRNVVVFP